MTEAPYPGYPGTEDAARPWVVSFLQEGACRLLGRDCVAAVTGHRWLRTSTFLFLLSVLSDTLQVFSSVDHNVCLRALAAAACLFAPLLLLVLVRTPFRARLAVPTAGALVLCLFLGAVALTQAVFAKEETGITGALCLENADCRALRDRVEGIAADVAELLRISRRTEAVVQTTQDNTKAILDQQTQNNALLAELLRRSASQDTKGVPATVVVELARRIAPAVSDVDQAWRELESAVAIAAEVQRGGIGSADRGTLVSKVLDHLAKMTSEGRFEDASLEADRAFARWEQDEAQRREAEQARGLALLDAGVRQDLLRRDAAAVATKLARRVDLTTPDATGRLSALRAVQDEWYIRGRDKGLSRDLAVSVELARVILGRAVTPEERGSAFDSLGISLRTLGERESGTALLEKAVTAHSAALQERNREREPLAWATTQFNLGNALWRQGERESGPTRLLEAVQSYSAALQERTRERAPLDWAMTHVNLGSALARLGERESGTVRLEQAVHSYRAALQEQTRERVPLDWAMTQNSLGNVLLRLGERQSGTERLKDAAEAYRAALNERTRERVPLDWATTQNNLGNVLLRLGDRENDTAMLEAAVAAYRAALNESTRDRAPLDWAMTQNNLGTALRILGERDHGTERLEESVADYRAALEEYTRERVPLDWAMTQNNLGTALRILGERESGTARLENAVAAFRAALEEYTRQRVPLQWAGTQTNLGTALRALGERESGTARLEEAVSAYHAALEELTRERVPLDWAGTAGNRASVWLVIAGRTEDLQLVRRALADLEEAGRVGREGGHAPIAEFCSAEAAEARALIARLEALSPSLPP